MGLMGRKYGYYYTNSKERNEGNSIESERNRNDEIMRKL